MKLRRAVKSVTNLEALLQDLKSSNIISENAESVLEDCFSDTLNDLFKRMSKNKNEAVTTTAKYSAALRTFSLTLNFLSSKAYNYVRQTFYNALPHPSTLGRWYSNINGEPGITVEALKALHMRVQEKGEVYVALTFDEMSIRKHIDLDGAKNIGYIDFGTGFDGDNVPVAGNVLVFMATSINSNWKVPVAYFFINTLTAEQKLNVTQLVVEKVCDTGVRIVSVTCDGPTTNVSMAKHFGLNLSVSNFDTKLSISGQNIYFMLDNCHMIKLVRNCLFRQGLLYDVDDNVINVQFIKELVLLQESEGLHLANKLKSTHLDWVRQPMKVKLATQTLSTSVADAIDYCCNVLKLPQFQNCEGTTKFIRIFDRLFDIFNSRNPLGRGYKAPLKSCNEKFWRPFLEESFIYIRNLRFSNGQLASESRNQTPFIGYLILIRSIIDIFATYVKCDQLSLKYLLTYKMSQDHLELFFSSIRSRGGFNNNPTARQFTAAYKRLLIRHELVHTKSNCLSLDSTSILGITSVPLKKCVSANTSLIIDRYKLFDDNNEEEQNIPCFSNLSTYMENVVEYIAGFVVNKLQKLINCTICLNALYSSAHPSFIQHKSSGKLCYPSLDVLKICKSAERICRKILHMCRNNPPNMKNICESIVNVVYCDTYSVVFSDIADHILDQHFNENHLVQLIKRNRKKVCST